MDKPIDAANLPAGMLRVIEENVYEPQSTSDGVQWWSGAVGRRLLRLYRCDDGTYSIVERQGGQLLASRITTTRGLYRALLAIEAGHDNQRPADRPGVTWFAKRQSSNHGTATIWVARRRPFAPDLDGCLCHSYYDRTGEHAPDCPVAVAIDAAKAMGWPRADKSDG